MRIWDLAPKRLCRQHLLGEQRELHAIWSISTVNKTGYSNHPEVLRWKGRLKALYIRHERLVTEMKKRGYMHRSPLSLKFATGKSKQDRRIHSYKDQIMILKNKKCRCALCPYLMRHS